MVAPQTPQNLAPGLRGEPHAGHGLTPWLVGIVGAGAGLANMVWPQTGQNFAPSFTGEPHREHCMRTPDPKESIPGRQLSHVRHDGHDHDLGQPNGENKDEWHSGSASFRAQTTQPRQAAVQD